MSNNNTNPNAMHMNIRICGDGLISAEIQMVGNVIFVDNVHASDVTIYRVGDRFAYHDNTLSVYVDSLIISDVLYNVYEYTLDMIGDKVINIARGEGRIYRPFLNEVA